MKITLLLPHIKVNGGNRISLTYANLLAHKGHVVTVCIISRKWWRRCPANLLNKKPYWIKNFKPRVLRVAEFDTPHIPDGDIIMTCAWQTNKFMDNYPKNKGEKFQLIMHDERIYHGEPKEVNKIYALPVHKIAISTWIHDMLQKDFDKNSNILITPVDLELFHPVKIDKNPNEISILMLHHVYKWKGVADGIKAFQTIKVKHPEVKLILFGVRSSKPNVPHDKYYYDFPQEKLKELYSQADIFLCPSEWEGLGMPAMEAMACGTAVVTYDTGGSRDYALDNQTAFVAEHANIESLTQKLELAITNKDLRQKISQQGYNFIKNNIDSWQESVAKLEKLFKKALNKK